MPTWTNIVKNVANWLTNYFLLKEDGDYLLLETGDKIIIGGSRASRNTSWSNQSKS